MDNAEAGSKIKLFTFLSATILEIAQYGPPCAGSAISSAKAQHRANNSPPSLRLASSASPSSSPQQSASALASAHTATVHAQTLAAHPNRSRDGSGTARQNCQIGSEPASRPNRFSTATVGPAAPCPCGRAAGIGRLVCRAAGRRETDPHRGLQVEVEACCVQQDRESGTAGCLLPSSFLPHDASYFSCTY